MMVVAAVDTDVYTPAGPPVEVFELRLSADRRRRAPRPFAVRRVAGEVADPAAVGVAVISPRGAATVNPAGRFVDRRRRRRRDRRSRPTPPRTVVVPRRGRRAGDLTCGPSCAPSTSPVTPGDVTIIEIEVANTADVIDGVTARVEGIDPSWVHLPMPVLSLFPESTGVLPIHVRFPPTTVVGDYLVVINVESTIDADAAQHPRPVAARRPGRGGVAAAAPERRDEGQAGRRSRAIVANEGNVPTDFTMTAVDETRVLDCSAQPLTLTVPPGVGGRRRDRRSRGRRPWFGQPVARTVTIGAESRRRCSCARSPRSTSGRASRGAC